MNYFEYIDEYKSSALTESEMADFERAMDSDEKLRHAVENYSLIKTISAALIEDEVRQNLSNLQSNQKKIVPVYFKWSAIAAGFVLLVGSFFIYRSFSSSKNYRILAFYERPSENITRGTENSINAIDTAIQLFNLNRFDEAKLFLLSPHQSDSTIQIANFYLANIAFIQKEYKSSESFFTILTDHEKYGNTSKFNLLLIYLITGNKEKAKRLFESIKSDKIVDSDKIKALEKLL